MLCHLFLLEHCKRSERSCFVICFCPNIVNTQRDNALSFVSVNIVNSQGDNSLSFVSVLNL